MRSGPRVLREPHSGEVHVWWFRLDRSPDELRRAAGWLAPDERDRVARFRFPHLREQATAARGLLRSLLSRYLRCDPSEVEFDYGPRGKPYLPGEHLQFNLAHSGGLGVCALMMRESVGVDVELKRSDLDYAAIGDRSFSDNERAALARLGAEGAANGFFVCWTRKEAYIKGRGEGLSIPLDSFDVPLEAATIPIPVVSREACLDAHGWYVRDLQVGPAYAASVAARGADWRVDDRGWLTLDDATQPA